MKKKNLSLFLCVMIIGVLAFCLLGNIKTAAETNNVQTTSMKQENKSGEDTQKGKSGDTTVTEVEVTESKEEEAAHDANVGVLGDKDSLDTPFNITSYTSQTIENEQADTLSDVLIIDPSVRFATSAGDSVENFKIRGFDVNYQYLYFNGMPGLAPQFYAPVEFLDRVEVLKGPSSFLYGGMNTSVGGAINLVPKRAGEKDISAFTADYTSPSDLSGHIDIGRRFGEKKEWGIRFNGVYTDGGTEIDGQSKEQILGALGVDYQKNQWQLSLDAYHSKESYDNGTTSMYSFAGGYVKAPDGSTNLYPGISGAMENTGILVKSEYDIQNNLTAYAAIGTLSANATGFIIGNLAQKLQTDGKATVSLYKQNLWTETTSSEMGLRGTYQTGAVKHQLVLGTNSMNTDFSSAFVVSSSYATNIDNPISLADYFNNLQQPGKGNKTTSTELSSFVLSDTLSFIEDKMQLTLGVRQQNVDQTTYSYSTKLDTGKPTSTSTYKSDAATPMVGLIVKPWGDSVSLYANYIEALSPGTVVGTTYNNANEVLAPYKTRQHEIGVKWDNGNFTNTLALFQIDMPSYMTTNNIYSYDGKQSNSGIEWNIFGSVAKNLRLLGGIAYTHGELVRSNTSANDGNTPFGIPEWTINTSAELDAPWVQGFTLSLRSIYTSSQYINNANTIEIPSWIRYDLGAQYKTMIKKKPIIYRLSVENLFNEHYWEGCFSTESYITLGAPRTIKLSGCMQF